MRRSLYTYLLSRMLFSVVIDVSFPTAFYVFLFPEDVGVGARFQNMLGNRFDIGGLQQFLEALTFDELTETFAVLAFFHPPVPDVFDHFFDLVVGIFGFYEGHQHGAHLGAVQNRGLGADEVAARPVAHVPEDRQHLGLIMDFAAWENVAFGYQDDPAYNAGRWMTDNAAIKTETAGKMERFDVRPPNPRLAARNFSGGNQQKAVVAKWLGAQAKVLIFDEPTSSLSQREAERLFGDIGRIRSQSFVPLKKNMRSLLTGLMPRWPSGLKRSSPV